MSNLPENPTTDSADPSSSPAAAGKPSIWVRLFDIRSIIATLLGLYGVLLLIAGVAPSVADAGAKDFAHTPDRADLSAGSAGNLWVGAALVIVALGFAAWVAIGNKRAGG